MSMDQETRKLGVFAEAEMEQAGPEARGRVGRVVQFLRDFARPRRPMSMVHEQESRMIGLEFSVMAMKEIGAEALRLATGNRVDTVLFSMAVEGGKLIAVVEFEVQPTPDDAAKAGLQ